MKIAICFYGLVGSVNNKNGIGNSLDPKIGFEYFDKNILSVNDSVDVFLHSWSVDSKEELNLIYKPKKSIIENQLYFPKSINHPEINKGFMWKIKKAFYKIFNTKKHKSLKLNREKESFRAYSRWYSVKKSLQLMKDYETENSFKYDAVMSTRLDVAFFKPINFSSYNLNYFHASHWNDPAKPNQNIKANYLNHFLGKGFLDFWFFSNSDLMFDFSRLFDKIENYPISPHVSSRQHVDTLTDKIEYVFIDGMITK